MTIHDLDARLKRVLVRRHGKHVRGVVTRRVIDSTGDPAVWIWVILGDDSLLKQEDRTEIERIRATAESESRKLASDWPYVTFRTEEEQSEFTAAESKQK